MHKIIQIGPLHLIHSHFSGFESAALGVFLKTGARFEKKEQKGIAHFLEHMVFKGSSSYSYKQIKRDIEGRGGILNGFTSQEITAYYACFLKKNTLTTLDILLDMVLNPLLLPREIDKERNVVLEEIKMYNDLASSRARTLLDSLLWQRHPLGQDIIGHESSIKKISKEDLLSFKKNFYTASNIIVSFCGDFSLDKIKKTIEKKINKREKKKRMLFSKPVLEKGVKVKIEKKDTQQLHICLGFLSIPYGSVKKFTQQLLHVVLGANMSSRLFENLREKKSLCYDVSTEIREFADSGAFIIRLGLDKEKIKVALSAIKNEILKIKNKEVKKSELTRAKDYFLGQFSMNLEQPQGRMFYLAQSYIRSAKIESPESLKAKVGAVNPSQIKDFSVRLFDFDNASVAAVGNTSQALAEEIKKALKL